MRTKGLLVRSNVPIPPPSGPVRTDFCLQAGLDTLQQSTRLAGKAFSILGLSIAGGWDAAPVPYGLENPGSGHFVEEADRRRVSNWFKLRDETWVALKKSRLLGFDYPLVEWYRAKGILQRALKGSIEAYHWLSDVSLDIGSNTLIAAPDGREWGSIGSLVEAAHVLTHRVGEVAGGLFGCKFLHEDGAWYDTCEVSLMHIPYGHSIGFTARHICTICAQDFGDCQHRRGENYEVVVSRTADGACSICGGHTCTHSPGSTVKVRATTTMKDPILREVTLTPRPRDPLTRITAREVEVDRLAELLGWMPAPGDKILNHQCMQHCEGFRSPYIPDDDASRSSPIARAPAPEGVSDD